jgi:Spy/CpxP family protein refolding chaperone
MRLKYASLMCLLAVIGLSLAASCVYAGSQDRQPRQPEKSELCSEKKDDRLSEILQRLNLSTEQDKQLQACRKKHVIQAKEIDKRLRAKRKELKQELQNQELHRDKINQLHSELKVLLGQREDHRLEGILEVRKILTSEQLARFLELIERFHPGQEEKEQDHEQSKN